jgi:hypothetical protein
MAEETTHPQTPLSNPALAQLESFAGTWQWEASVDGQPIGRGPTTFAWLEGGTFLVEHADAEQAEFPSSTAIFGCDDTTETYCMFQVDSRGISRIYRACAMAFGSCGGTLRGSHSASRARSVTMARPSAVAGRNQATARLSTLLRC